MIAGEDIFISYRRDDAAAYAGRILDYLSSVAGARKVFMDVEGIGPGENFAQTIDETLARCKTVLVVIGPKWRQILEERAKQNQEDYVVHEIAAALKRKANVVPVLVGGATAAEMAGLPETLAELPFHQAVQMHDDSFKEDCGRLAAGLNLKPRGMLRNPLLWAGVTAAVFIVGLIAPWRAWMERNERTEQVFKTAAAQSEQHDYKAAFDSYQQILNVDPTNARALDGQTDAAMMWAENFHVLAGEGQKAEDLPAAPLEQLKQALQAASARVEAKSSRAADILAHLGWVHWLNEKIAFKEFGGAEALWRKSLEIDPANVYGHAMLANWLLQTRKDLPEALRQLDLALKTGKRREFVRELQLGGLHYYDDPAARWALAKALNEMRKAGEPLDEQARSRFSYLYMPNSELSEVLAAMSKEDAWATYLWLTPQAGEEQRKLMRERLAK